MLRTINKVTTFIFDALMASVLCFASMAAILLALFIIVVCLESLVSLCGGSLMLASLGVAAFISVVWGIVFAAAAVWDDKRHGRKGW